MGSADKKKTKWLFVLNQSDRIVVVLAKMESIEVIVGVVGGVVFLRHKD